MKLHYLLSESSIINVKRNNIYFTCQIAFEGITESGYQGDMAIDDVSVTDGPCPLDQRVTPVKVSVNSTSVASEGKIFARKIRKKTKKESKPKPAQ